VHVDDGADGERAAVDQLAQLAGEQRRALGDAVADR
jgi:hypothetical protein